MRLEYFDPMGYPERPYHHNNDSDPEVFVDDDVKPSLFSKENSLYMTIIGVFIALKVL